MGRRAYKKVTTNGSVTLHQRYIYRGYLQIACVDLTRNHHPVMWLITWDATQPVASRPLAIRINGTWYTYGWDLTKNICEVYRNNGYIGTAYTYSPYGEVKATGNIEQPIQWSSEVVDAESSFVCYNYRYYSTSLGRFCERDIIYEDIHKNIYIYVDNSPLSRCDMLGRSWYDSIYNAVDWSWQEIKASAKYVYEKSCEINREYKLVERTLGAVQVTGGVLEASIGITGIVAPEPSTSVAGAVMLAHSIDVIYTGIDIVINGEVHPTITNNAIREAAESVGVEPEYASYIATGAEMAIGGKVLNTNLTNAPAKIMVTAESTELVAVSRWGSKLEANNWVMQGRPTLWNYIWSGKYQIGWGNQFASPYNVQWYMVPKRTLQCPKGKGIDGFIKLLLPARQRIYRP